MRIEPQDEKRAALIGGMARHAGHGAHGQRMIAAQHKRKSAGACSIINSRIESACEGADDLQVVGLWMMGEVACRKRVQITLIRNDMPKFRQGRVHACDTQGSRPHRRTAAAGAFFERCADQRDVLVIVSHGFPAKRECRLLRFCTIIAAQAVGKKRKN